MLMLGLWSGCQRNASERQAQLTQRSKYDKIYSMLHTKLPSPEQPQAANQDRQRKLLPRLAPLLYLALGGSTYAVAHATGERLAHGRAEYAAQHADASAIRAVRTTAGILAADIVALHDHPPAGDAVYNQPLGGEAGKPGETIDLNFTLTAPPTGLGELQYMFTLQAQRQADGRLHFTPASELEVSVMQTTPKGDDLLFDYQLQRQPRNLGDGMAGAYVLHADYGQYNQTYDGYRFSTDVTAAKPGVLHLLTEQVIEYTGNQAFDMIAAASSQTWPQAEYPPPLPETLA